MVSADDCPCADTTEASNITSLQSDSYIIDTNVKEARCEPIIAGNNILQELKDCKCYEIRSSGNCGVPECGITDTVMQSLKKEPLKDQCSMKEIQSTVPCLCHAHKIAYTLPLKCRNDAPCSGPRWCPFKWKWPKKRYLDRKNKAYEVKLRQNKCPHYTEPFMCCEISEGIPNKRKCDALKIARSLEEGKPRSEPTERIDIYYFDHGNSAYYRTTDSPPILATEKCAEKTDQAATRFWAEIFGTIHIGTAFVTAFILQFVRFILYSIFRPLTVGILQLFADYFIKPLLSIFFNALVQPVLILLYNVATSFKDLCEPIAEAIGLFLREIANLFAAIRVVEVRQGVAPSAPCVSAR